MTELRRSSLSGSLKPWRSLRRFRQVRGGGLCRACEASVCTRVGARGALMMKLLLASVSSWKLRRSIRRLRKVRGRRTRDLRKVRKLPGSGMSGGLAAVACATCAAAQGGLMLKLLLDSVSSWKLRRSIRRLRKVWG